MCRNILTAWAKFRPDEQERHRRWSCKDEAAIQAEVQYCTDCMGINGAGRWNESCRTYPGRSAEVPKGTGTTLYIEGGADSAEVSRGRSSWKTRKGIAAKDRKDTCRAVHLTTVMRALSNRKLEEWGCPSASRYFESVHPKYSVFQLQLVF